MIRVYEQVTVIREIYRRKWHVDCRLVVNRRGREYEEG